MRNISTLSPTEIKILKQLREGRASLPSLKGKLGLSSQQISRTVSSLREKGFVLGERKGITKTIWISDMKHAQLLRTILIQYNHMRLEKILSMSSLEILMSISSSSGMTRKEIAFSSQKSQRTVATALSRLREFGMLITDRPGIYRISPRFIQFTEFAMELRRQSDQRAVASLYQDGVIRWQGNRSVLIESKIAEERGGFRSTSFSAFHRFATTMLLARHWYINLPDNRKPRLEEVIVHTMLLKPFDSRESSLFQELLRKTADEIDMKDLTRLAAEYGAAQNLPEIARDLAKWRKAPYPAVSLRDSRKVKAIGGKA
jgi:DNA-binding MarR family transcriptional regulator